MRRAAACAAALCLALTGCAQTPPVPAETPAGSLSPVFTDASRLTPYEPPERVWEYWDGTPRDHLIPDGGYGTLIPFRGGVLADRNSSWSATDLYGLATLDGKIVVDPVYTIADQLELRDGNGATGERLPFLLLSTEEGEDGSLSALAAPDGSWCTEARYYAGGELLRTQPDATRLYLIRDDGWLVLLDDRGEVREVADLSGLLTGPMDRYDVLSSVQTMGDGLFFSRSVTDAEGVYQQQNWRVAPDGGLSRVPAPANVNVMRRWSEGLIEAFSIDAGLWGYLDETGAWAVEPAYEGVDDFHNGWAAVSGGQVGRGFIDRTGRPAPIRFDAGARISWSGEGWQVMGEDETLLALLDKDLRPVEDCPLEGRELQGNLTGGIVAGVVGEEYVMFRAGEIDRFPAEYGQLDQCRNDLALLRHRAERADGSDRHTLVHLDGSAPPLVLEEGTDWAYLEIDLVTGEPYLRCDVEGKGSVLRSVDGRTIGARAGVWGWSTLVGGNVLTEEGGCTTLKKPDGTVLLRWVYDVGAD